jgi:hypothetical protein
MPRRSIILSFLFEAHSGFLVKGLLTRMVGLRWCPWVMCLFFSRVGFYKSSRFILLMRRPNNAEWERLKVMSGDMIE